MRSITAVAFMIVGLGCMELQAATPEQAGTYIGKIKEVSESLGSTKSVDVYDCTLVINADDTMTFTYNGASWGSTTSHMADKGGGFISTLGVGGPAMSILFKFAGKGIKGESHNVNPYVFRKGKINLKKTVM